MLQCKHGPRDLDSQHRGKPLQAAAFAKIHAIDQLAQTRLMLLPSRKPACIRLLYPLDNVNTTRIKPILEWALANSAGPIQSEKQIKTGTTPLASLVHTVKHRE